MSTPADSADSGAQRRAEWLEASIELTTRMLSPGGQPLQHLTEAAGMAARADLTTVILPTSKVGMLSIAYAAGVCAEEVLGEEVPVLGTNSGSVATGDKGALIFDLSALPRNRSGEARPHWLRFGPAMIVPMLADDRSRGALAFARLRSEPAFSPEDLDLATAFASHATLALELADARLVAERSAMLSNRERIARDLHDHVIQRLFAAGLTLEAAAMRLSADDGALLAPVLEQIDGAIGALRTSVFGLRGGMTPGGGALRARVIAVTGELAPLLGMDPRIRFAGPLDHVTDPDLLDEIEAVVRESLSNVARHARARNCDVLVTGEAAELTLEISDDGIGAGGRTRSSGLGNLAARAADRHGSFQVGPAPEGRYAEPGGTSVRWTIQLT